MPNLLSAKILESIPLVKETRLRYLQYHKEEISGCALGGAYHAASGETYVHDLDQISAFFEVPFEICAEAGIMHMKGSTREQVAKFVASKGF